MEPAESIELVGGILSAEHEAARKWDRRAADHLFKSLCTVLEPSTELRQVRNKALFNISLVLEGQEVTYESAHMAVTAECHFQVYGSCLVGTDVIGSDLDLSMTANLTLGPLEAGRRASSPRSDASSHRTMRLSEAKPHQRSQMRRSLLHAVADVLEASGAVEGPVQRILRKNIRVPLLRFVEAETGCTCDVSCCNDASVIKAELLKSVLGVDERAVHLVRLAKVWARHHGINDGAHGTLNSYALTTMVLYHLQSLPQPVVPALVLLLPPDLLAGSEPEPATSGAGMRSNGSFQQRNESPGSPGGGKARGSLQEPSQSVLEAAADTKSAVDARCVMLARQGYGLDNTDSIADLFASFIVRFMVITRAWVGGSGDGIAVSAYEGRLGVADESLHDYVMIVEDPFDSRVNTASTVRGNQNRSAGFGQTSRKIGKAFERTAKALEGSSGAQDQRAAMHGMVEAVFGAEAAAALPPDSFIDSGGAQNKKKKQAVRKPKNPGSPAKARGDGGGRGSSGRSSSSAHIPTKSRGRSGASGSARGGSAKTVSYSDSDGAQGREPLNGSLQLARGAGQKGGGAGGAARRGGRGGSSAQPRKRVATRAMKRRWPQVATQTTLVARSPVWLAAVRPCRQFHACANMGGSGSGSGSCGGGVAAQVGNGVSRAPGSFGDDEKACFWCMQAVLEGGGPVHGDAGAGVAPMRRGVAAAAAAAARVIQSNASSCDRVVWSRSVRGRALRRVFMAPSVRAISTALRM